MLKGFFAGLLANTLEIGSVVEDFTVRDTDGKQHTLSRLLENGPVIVAFFPKAFTPG